MQKKTIERVISKKLEEWLSTINDESLSQRIKDNIIVTGGCITSLFQNNQVNDFDVYIESMDVLLEIANYYCKGKMEIFDGRKKEYYIKQHEKEFGSYEYVFNEKDSSKRKVFIDNLHSDQIKLYSYDNSWKLESRTSNEDEGLYEPLFMSPNAITLSDDIQIVLRFSGSIENIHENFDFVHATNYFTFKDGLVVNEKALLSILTMGLKYQGSKYPLTSVIRMKKFISRGWTINAGEILKILMQVSELDLKDVRVLEEQLIGVDIAYFDTLIKIMKGVPNEKITTEYISELIEKLFNNYNHE